MQMRGGNMKKRDFGFTLLELLIVVAIIGIIAAIAIPNFMDSLQKARQKRSVSEIRTMVVSLQSFSVDYGGYPNQSHNGIGYINLPLVLDQDGEPIMVPTYIQAIPHLDGWNSPYYYFAGPDGTIPTPRIQGGEVVAGHFCYFSYGADLTPSDNTDGSVNADDLAASWCQNPPVAVGTRDTSCFESDIVWGDAQFQQSPSGKQRHCL